MGTRSTTDFVNTGEDGSETILATLYRQYDGYPDGHGLDLAKAMEGAVMVNGIPVGSDERTMFNGMGDLAVRVISLLKGDASRAGDFYLHPPDGKRNEWVDYHYKITAPPVGARLSDRPADPVVPSISVYDGQAEDPMWTGTVEEFLAVKNWYPSDEDDED